MQEKACNGSKLHKHRISSLPPSYIELTFLIQLTSSLLSWRNQRTAQPWVIFHWEIQKSNLWIRKTWVCTPCSFLYHPHTHTYFQSSITTSIILRSAFELSHAIHLDKTTGKNDCGKRQQQSSPALLPAVNKLSASPWKCHSKGYSWLALSFGTCWTG